MKNKGMEFCFPRYRSLKRKCVAAFVFSVMICISFFSSCSKKRDVQPEKAILSEVVEPDTIYYKEKEIQLIDDEEEGSVRIIGTAGSEETIAVLIHIDRIFTGEYQLLLIDKNGEEKNRLFLRKLIHDPILEMTDRKSVV